MYWNYQRNRPKNAKSEIDDGALTNVTKFKVKVW